MPENQPLQKKSITPDWLVRGILTKIGDIFDRLTGRGWKPSSSLATSELIERLKALLDAEAENPDGRGYFVPHNIELKMQWDKFSADSDEPLRKLENEMLTAAIDHINDRRYYTYQPLSVEVRPDYFTSGVKLFVSFDKILDEDEADAMHVIVPGVAEAKAEEEIKRVLVTEKFILHFTENGKPKVQSVEFVQDKRKGVGRTKENDIAIDDASVSKLHAALVLNSEGRLVLADTGSTNGTFINGVRIAYGKAEPLSEGDKVNFGTVEVTFQRIPKQPQPADESVSPTQADTVSINGLEFTSKRPEQPTEAYPAQAPMEKTIDPVEFAKRAGEAPMQNTIASNDVVLKAIETPTGASEKDLTFSDIAPKSTENRIDFDFSEQRKKGAWEVNLLLLLAQIDWQKYKPENLFGGQVLERTPAGLTIVYIIGVGILLGFLLLSFLDNFGRPRFIFEADLPREVMRKLTQTVANRSVRAWQVVFVLLALAVFGFQVYWVYFADETNQEFQALAYKDLRTRRLNAATLRPWMLDRTGKLEDALANYKIDKDGNIGRNFPLDKEMAHLLGTERGTPGLERTLYKRGADPMPEAWEILTKYRKPQVEDPDVRITIDHDLQAYVASQLEGKKGAIVVLNPQTGDVLAMYSNPSYSLSDVQTLEGYLKLEGDKANKPLLSRAIREYYTPGSTFKTLTMMSAFRAGKQDFLGFDLPAPDCYTPSKGSRPICDAGGSCEICHGDVPIRDAFKVSSNQYFAELANFLGRDRMGETARLLGIAAVDKPEEALTQGYFPEIWNTSDKRIANSISPARSTIVVGKGLTLFDFGLEGMGQGLASQQTPFQMAMIASVPGNLQGRLMKPKIEADLQPQAFSQVLNPQQAAEVREIMSTVTEEAGGTGGAVRAALAGTGIMAGGKTGTAEKDDVPRYDPKTGERIFVLKKKKDKDGNIVEYKEYLTFNRTDGWFICIAPLENPQVAIAVVIEDIGNRFGGQTAAPVAANVVLKARNLGLLGDKYTPKQAPPPKTSKKKPK